MIFEITRDYTIIVPLMIANLIAISFPAACRRSRSTKVCCTRTASTCLRAPGVRAKETILHVSDALHPGGEPLPASLTVADARARADQRHNAWPVADGEGLRGMVSAQRLDQAIASGQGGELLGALVPEPGPGRKACRRTSFRTCMLTISLDVALRKLGETGWGRAPRRKPRQCPPVEGHDIAAGCPGDLRRGSRRRTERLSFADVVQARSARMPASPVRTPSRAQRVRHVSHFRKQQREYRQGCDFRHRSANQYPAGPVFREIARAHAHDVGPTPGPRS